MEEDLYGYDEGGGIATEEEPSAFANAAVGFDPRAPNIGRFQPWDQRAPQLNVPEGEVDWDYVRKAVAAKAQTDAMNARRQAAQAKMQQDAVRFAGQREFEELIKGGATPQEALRRTLGKLTFQDPKAMVSAAFAAQEKTPEPIIRNVGGSLFERNDKGGWDKVIEKPEPDTMGDFVKKSEYQSALSAYKRAKLGEKGDKPGERVVDHSAIADTARRLRLAEQNLTAKPQEPLQQITKELTKEIALDFVKQAKGDKELARKLAKEAGYKF